MKSGASAVHEAWPAGNGLRRLYPLLDDIGFFEPKPDIAVAVSGGADSMALLLLLKFWVEARNGSVIALTVNHGLRPEAAKEAAWVSGECKRHGIEHHTLTYQGNKPTAAIQEKARDIRYTLLTDWCRAHDVLHLFTAHHAGDQVETLFFRLARGSGLSGLAGIPVVSLRNGVRLIRPLLGFNKAELMQFLETLNQKWIEDPSNQNPAYTRTHIRQILHDAGLEDRATDVSVFMANFRRQFEWQQMDWMSCVLQLYPAGYATINAKEFRTSPPVMALQGLASLLQTISGSDTPPRSQTLHTLYDSMQKKKELRQNVAGCMVSYRPKDGLFYFWREKVATASPAQVRACTVTQWDGRFEAYFEHPGGMDTLSLQPLGSTGLNHLPKIPAGMRHLPPAILRSFPAFFHLEQLLCAPHMSYKHPEYGNLHCSLRFRPTKPLAGAPFCGMNKITS